MFHEATGVQDLHRLSLRKVAGKIKGSASSSAGIRPLLEHSHRLSEEERYSHLKGSGKQELEMTGRKSGARSLKENFSRVDRMVTGNQVERIVFPAPLGPMMAENSPSSIS